MGDMHNRCSYGGVAGLNTIFLTLSVSRGVNSPFGLSPPLLAPLSLPPVVQCCQVLLARRSRPSRRVCARFPLRLGWEQTDTLCNHAP